MKYYKILSLLVLTFTQSAVAEGFLIDQVFSFGYGQTTITTSLAIKDKSGTTIGTGNGTHTSAMCFRAVTNSYFNIPYTINSRDLIKQTLCGSPQVMELVSIYDESCAGTRPFRSFGNATQVTMVPQEISISLQNAEPIRVNCL